MCVCVCVCVCVCLYSLAFLSVVMGVPLCMYVYLCACIHVQTQVGICAVRVHRGGLDGFLRKARESELSTKAQRIKREIAKAEATATAS